MYSQWHSQRSPLVFSFKISQFTAAAGNNPAEAGDGPISNPLRTNIKALTDLRVIHKPQTDLFQRPMA